MTRAHQKLQPAVSALAAQAREVWDFCEGWNPDRLPIACAYAQVDDVEMVIELLKEMRQYLAERKEFAQRVADMKVN